jgi:leucyl/phenylalanyl-tRNA--protein transferase
LAWWSPVRRGILPVDGLRIPRSLRRSLRRFDWSVDEAFEDVVSGCAEPSRPHGWITPDIAEAYIELHRLGHAHSIETWESGRLVGGLYGVSLGGVFAGESMFHRVADASKAALVHLVEIMTTTDEPLVDTQWQTAHLASLGGIEVSRDDYLRRLAVALRSPIPEAFTST